MADTLKEIYAGTLTVADIATNGSATLATTDANTQYVIKDVSVSGVFTTGNTPALSVNGYSVADLSSSATGSEIVDVSSTIKYQAFPSAPVLTQTTLKYISGVADAYRYQDGIIYALNGTTTSTTAQPEVTVTSNFSGASVTSQFARSNDGSIFWVNWDGNSSTTLYKRAGGVNGTQTTLQTLSYSWCVFNGVDSYYYAISSTIYKYNINTGATTSITYATSMSGTSYPSAYVMNDGNLLVNYSGNGQTNALYIVSPTTAVYCVITGLADVSISGSNYRIAGYYDASTSRYTLYKRMTGTLYKTKLNGAVSLASTNTYSGGVTNSSYTIGTVGSPNINTYTVVGPDTYTVAVHNQTGKTELAVFNTLTNSSTNIPWLTQTTDSDKIIQNTTTSSDVSNFTNSVKVRVTGVKSTI